MKFDCDIIKDLLPLYSEDVCSEKSKLAINEHLSECPSCSEALNTLKTEINVKNDYSDKESIKKIKKGIKKEKYKTIKLSILISFLVVLTIGWFSAKYVLVQTIKNENKYLTQKTEVIKIENTVKGTENLAGLHYWVPDGMEKETSDASVKYTNSVNSSLILINYGIEDDIERQISDECPYFTRERIKKFIDEHNIMNRSDLLWYCSNYNVQNLSVFSNLSTLEEAVYVWCLTRNLIPDIEKVYKIEAENFDGIIISSYHSSSVWYSGRFQKDNSGGSITLVGLKENVNIDDMKKIFSSFSFND